MELQEKIYLHDLKEGAHKSILKSYVCINCELIPHYEINKPLNGEFKINLVMEGWNKIENQLYCPNCIRRIKIERIKYLKS
jgi:rubredoxin